MICQGCMTELSGAPKFCPKCGARIETADESAPSIKYCPQCGTENPVSAKFCKNDGYPFAAAASAASLAPQTARRAEVSDTPAEVEPLVASVPLTSGVSFETEATSSRAKAAAEIPPAEVPISPGIATAESFATTEPPRVDLPSRKAKPRFRGLLIGIAVLVAVVAAGGAGYWYWSENQAASKVLEAGGGAGNVSPAVSPAAPAPAVPQGTAQTVTNPAPAAPPPPAAAPAAVDKPPKVDVARIQQELNQQLLKAGFGDLYAQVNSDGSVDLTGPVASKKSRDEAVRIALSHYGVERVNPAGLQVVAAARSPNPPPQRLTVAPPPPLVAPTLRADPAKLEGDINRTLRSNGIGGVTAQVGDDFSVTLKGSATSAGEKNRAFQITRQFRGVGAMRDRVFVVE
jgi:osmotically-inducible protein OsmY